MSTDVSFKTGCESTSFSWRWKTRNNGGVFRLLTIEDDSNVLEDGFFIYPG